MSRFMPFSVLSVTDYSRCNYSQTCGITHYTVKFVNRTLTVFSTYLNILQLTGQEFRRGISDYQSISFTTGKDSTCMETTYVLNIYNYRELKNLVKC